MFVLCNSRTQAVLVGAVLMLRCLPEKLNPVVKPLMESVKREENEILQVLSFFNLNRFMKLFVVKMYSEFPRSVLIQIDNKIAYKLLKKM